MYGILKCCVSKSVHLYILYMLYFVVDIYIYNEMTPLITTHALCSSKFDYFPPYRFLFCFVFSTNVCNWNNKCLASTVRPNQHIGAEEINTAYYTLTDDLFVNFPEHGFIAFKMHSLFQLQKSFFRAFQYDGCIVGAVCEVARVSSGYRMRISNGMFNHNFTSDSPDDKRTESDTLNNTC